MKVIIISRHNILPFGTTQLRCIQPYEYLNKAGIQVDITELVKYNPTSEDILILHRVTANPYNRALIQYAQAHNTKVIYDTDDLIFNSKGVNYLSKLGMKKYSKGKNKLKKLIGQCDAVSVSTSPLNYYAKKLNPNTFTIKNALSYSFFEKALSHFKSQSKNKSQNNDKVITLAYLSGSGTHDDDFSVISDALFNILTDFPNTELLIVGPLSLEKRFFSFGERLTVKKFMPYDEFQNIFQHIDINLIPLVEEDFCQCKSELKFIEAAAFLVPSIASPTTPHTEVINNNINGLLVEDGTWYENIKKLLDNSIRKKMGEEAYKTVSELYAPSAREKDWKSLLQTVKEIESKNNPKPVKMLFIKFNFHLFKYLTIIYEKQKTWERSLRTTFYRKK